MTSMADASGIDITKQLRDGTILDHCSDELDKLGSTINAFRDKLSPLYAPSIHAAGADISPQESPRNKLHEIEIEIRKLNAELVTLLHSTEL